jgi:enoyl-CoA hydratase/3-hydroxyacyl-CoA dehydrogenase
MIVGVIGSGAIGPDLAYGFASNLDKVGGGKVFLLDIRKEALDAGMKRLEGYLAKALDKGKMAPKAAQAVKATLVPTMEIRDLADCDYVLEAATEDLATKQKIIASLEAVVRPDCLIGFATSGIPRAKIVAGVAHPERCFVNHPFFPAWRSPPVEVVLSGDEGYGRKMLDTLKALGKVPIVTADVECFAADDVFVNYCAEAARIVEEGLATPAQVDAVVNDAIGGGGPFNVMDLTKGNLLNVHCLELMRDAPTGSSWFTPPPIFTKQGNTPWHDPANPGNPKTTKKLAKEIVDRILAVVFARTFFVADRGICGLADLNWLTTNALGYRRGLLDLAEEFGVERVHAVCTEYAAKHPGFTVPDSIANRSFPKFLRNLRVERDGEVAIVTIFRPEVKNALNEATIRELDAVFAELGGDATVAGIVLTSFDGSLAGADINELAALGTAEEAAAKCRSGQGVLSRIAATGKPVVAAVSGPVLGGGSELSMACHARVVGADLLAGQPEVNLGIIPGYGGTQRLPRLVGFARAVDFLRTGRPFFAKDACGLGWATGEPAKDVVAAAKELIRRHLRGEVPLAPVDPAPMEVPADFPRVDLGHHSLAVDAILCRVIREGLAKPLSEGLEVEALCFADCHRTVDYDIGMKNFIQNGPRVPAEFLHE